MAASRKVEDFVADIVQHIKASDYDELGEVYDTLQRMRSSIKQKHELNYWRVYQCLVEVAIDKMVLKLVRIDSISCKCHLSANMYCLMRFFVDSITTVNVIKRILYYKESFGPLCFKIIRQADEEQLALLGFKTMHRCLCVGKTELAEWYMKFGIMKDLYQFVKRKLFGKSFSYSGSSAVEQCAEILALLAECGFENTRKQIGRSNALRVLEEYVVQLEKSKTKEGAEYLRDKVSHVRTIMMDEKKAAEALSQWKIKDKLQDCLDDEPLLFCSSPDCRKLKDDLERFRYCGACKLARYCSESCQKSHWKLGHKTACLREPTRIERVP